MGLAKKNSILLVTYMYMTTILLLLKIIMKDATLFYVEYLFLLLLISKALLINKFRIAKKVMIIIIFLIILMLINIALVLYYPYVIPVVINIVLYSFLPLFILTSSEFDYQIFMKMWEKFAIVFSLLFPLYWYLYMSKIASYFDLGFYAHINIVVLSYYFFIEKDRNVFSVLLIGMNFLIGIIIGSRMLLISSIVTVVIMILVLTKDKNIKHYIKIISSGALLVVVFNNLEKILVEIQNITQNYGIRSRNLNLFIAQLRGQDIQELSSGRDGIYPLVIGYIKEHPILPSGLGVTRNLTNGQFYHAHNFFMESLLTFGTLGSLLILIWIVYRFILLVRFKKYDEYKFTLFLILSVAFLIRSLVGTYFLTDSFFLLAIGILMSKNVVKKK